MGWKNFIPDHPITYGFRRVSSKHFSHCYNKLIGNLLPLLAADPPAPRPGWVLLCFHHVSYISAGFHLIFSLLNRRSRGPASASPSPILLYRPVSGSPGSRPLPVFLSGTLLVQPTLLKAASAVTKWFLRASSFTWKNFGMLLWLTILHWFHRTIYSTFQNRFIWLISVLETFSWQQQLFRFVN
jgi:hypothetical protein